VLQYRNWSQQLKRYPRQVRRYEGGRPGELYAGGEEHAEDQGIGERRTIGWESGHGIAAPARFLPRWASIMATGNSKKRLYQERSWAAVGIVAKQMLRDTAARAMTTGTNNAARHEARRASADSGSVDLSALLFCG
jgi:hypothetical protein